MRGRFGALVAALTLMAATPAVAQDAPSRWDYLTADKSFAGFDCKVYCEVVAHGVSHGLMLGFGDDLLRLIPGIDATEAKLLAIGGTVGAAVGAEFAPFVDTFYDDAPFPAERRANAVAEVLEKTTWAFGEIGASTVGDWINAPLVGRFLGITFNGFLQWQLLPHRGIVVQE